MRIPNQNNYSEFSSVCESFVADTDSNVPLTGINNIMQNAELMADNSRTFVQNDISNMKCNIENDQLCRQIKTDLDNLSDIRATALNAYQNISDKYAKCKKVESDCNKNKTDRQIVESELKYLMGEKNKIQSVIQSCDIFETEIARLTPQINAIQNEINNMQTEINSISINNQKCSNNNNINGIINANTAIAQNAQHLINRGNRNRWFRFIYRRDISIANHKYNVAMSNVNAGRRCIEYLNKYKESTGKIATLRNTLNSIVKKQKNTCLDDRYTKYNRLNANHTSTQLKLNNLQSFDRINCKVVEDCETEYKPLVDAKYAEFNTATDQHSLKQSEHNTCKDPTKNQCSPFYNNINKAERDLAENVKSIRTGITTIEGMCENIDECTDQVKQDYSELEESRTSMKSVLAELGQKSTINKRIDETYFYAESTIYTNIILTTASISLLYYLFTRIK